MPTVNLKNLWEREMSINTPFNVTLTEGQIGVILCSLEKYVKDADPNYRYSMIDEIFEVFTRSLIKG